MGLFQVFRRLRSHKSSKISILVKFSAFWPVTPSKLSLLPRVCYWYYDKKLHVLVKQVPDRFWDPLTIPEKNFLMHPGFHFQFESFQFLHKVARNCIRWQDMCKVSVTIQQLQVTRMSITHFPNLIPATALILIINAGDNPLYHYLLKE